jgi:hypothetical protein
MTAPRRFGRGLAGIGHLDRTPIPDGMLARSCSPGAFSSGGPARCCGRTFCQDVTF